VVAALVGLAVTLSVLGEPLRQGIGAFFVCTALAAGAVSARRRISRRTGPAWEERSLVSVLARIATSWALTAVGVAIFANGGAAAGLTAGVGFARLCRRAHRRWAADRVRRSLPGLAGVVGPALVLSALFAGFVNYDTFYGLVWGHELAAGETPRFDLPVAPTPKPLTNALGLMLSPVGHGAEGVLVAGAFAALGGLGLVVYRLGAAWFSPAVGLLAAAIVLTREPVLSFGARAYVDVPFLLLVLGAALIETRRPRAGFPVVVLLVVAGLLRPEAWLLSAAYLAWLVPTRTRWDVARLALLALLAPVLWLGADLALTADPLFSLTGTRETAQLLERRTGLDDLPVTAARRLGEILREPVLIGAAGGGILALAYMRGRARLLAVVGVLALAAFTALAVAGLPLLGRYLLLPATILAIFCAVGAFGWLHVENRTVRRSWGVFGAAVIALLLAFAPAQARRLERLASSLEQQRFIRDDLHRLADSRALGTSCTPVSVPNHRLVPLLALWLDRRPADIISAQRRTERSGTFVAASNEGVERAFLLDPNDPVRLDAAPPEGFRLAVTNRSWRVYVRACGASDAPAPAHERAQRNETPLAAAGRGP
jgi:hypothetical protein